MAFRVRWPTQFGRILQRFGQNPDRYARFGLPGHEGIDLFAPRYSAVYAAADGRISDIRMDAFADPGLRPYGNQVWITHADGFESHYGHLAQVIVARGQPVRAKQLIALSGDTGDAASPHLHLGLRKRGATRSGETRFPRDLVDPEPYLVRFGSGEDLAFELPEVSTSLEVNSPSVGFASMRALPYAGSTLVADLDHGTAIGALESVESVRVKLGRTGQWLWVKTDGDAGWVAAAYVALAADGAPEVTPEPEADPRVSPDVVIRVRVETDGEHLRMRFGPGAGYPEVMRLSDGTLLTVLETPESLKGKIGQRDAWLYVQAPTGQVGYCAAQYVILIPFDPQPVVPQPKTGTPTAHVVVESPWQGLRLRSGPGTNHERIWWMPHRTVLVSLEDPKITGEKVGRAHQWIRVRTPSRHEGYAAAWHLRYPGQEDRRQPVDRTNLPTGLSPYVFGIHAVAVADEQLMRDRIRGLYHESGKAGWVFFTEICGRHMHAINPNPEIRRRLWDWADAGYGVIVRLNYGYEPGGTLPESRFYDDFATAAARWAEVYLTDGDRSPSDFTWTLQIGNEQNNPREHPGGFEHPTEHITAERYADAFNQTYARIKAVVPNASVCPGALDPYNYMPMRALGNARWRPLDYFATMMDRIHVLDGVILHAYTHGHDPATITHLKRFGNGTGPLWDHYYDFQTYRVFVERIPAKWRNAPVYITEMNHIHRPAGEHDQGWVNQNVGWVRAAYAEIDRWNRQPYAQQIRCGLLYRWAWDAWAIENKPEILTDFREALVKDYRWRGGGTPMEV
jgi:uncharacterized protein YraI